MNPALIAEIVKNNSGDIEAIISKVGIGTLLSLLPNILNILATVQKGSGK
jgi:hypothetical protein